MLEDQAKGPFGCLVFYFAALCMIFAIFFSFLETLLSDSEFAEDHHKSGGIGRLSVSLPRNVRVMLQK